MTETALSWYTPVISAAAKLNIRELVLYAMLGSLTFCAKAAMMMLPNIEPVSLMVMLFAVTFGRKCFYPISVYVALEFLVYGLNLWSINYLYIWFILAMFAWIFRDMQSSLGWAVLSGGFGLLFGLLCAPVYIVTGGIQSAIAWWISGIPFDLLHCAGNFAMALMLFCPMRKALQRLLPQPVMCRGTVVSRTSI